MPEEILNWFSSQGFIPHSYCLLKNPGIMALHVVSDASIALSYATIPVALTLFVKRRTDLEFSNIFVLFAGFILACAATHLFDIWTLWQPDYLAQGLVKALTASVSVATAIVIWPTLNKALSMPSPSQLAAVNRELSRESALLQASNARLDKVASRVPGVVFQYQLWPDGSHRLPYASQALLEVFGVEPDRVKEDAEPVFRILHPDDSPMVVASIRQSAQAMSLWEKEFRIRFADGRVKWLYGSATPEPAQDASIVWYAYVYDITERKLANLALVESERRFREMADSAPVMIWMSGPDKLCSYFNKTWLDFTGRTPEQEFGIGWAEGVHPDDLSHTLATYTTSFDAGKSFSLDYRLRRYDGEYRWVQNTGVARLDAAGTFLGFIGCCVDVTERKQVEDYFRAMVEASPNALMLVDENGQIALANREFEQLFGYVSSELIGRPVEILVTSASRQQHRRDRQAYFHHPGPRAMGKGREVNGRRKDGTTFQAEVGLNPLRIHDRQYVISAIVDITERRRAEQQIRELNASLERKVAERTAELTAASTAKTQFLAHMSHEIRTPMNAVLGLTQLLEREALTPGQTAMVRHIRESGDLLLHIINDILDLSKIEAGQLRFDLQPFELASLLTHMGQLFVNLADSKGISFQIQDCAADLGLLIGDSVRLEQVLMNLVSNAIKFTERGGVILEVSPQRVDTTTATLRFEVRDTGIGISQDAQTKLFQAFSQADASITRRFGGTGLGLAISKRLVELMGGHLDVVSEPGQGSTFWFEISLGRASESDPLSLRTLPQAQTGPRLTGLRVLAVDDNRINQFMLQRALQLEGATVSLAADGQQALDTLRASPQAFDVVLMDIQMPVMDGLTATRVLRGEPALAAVPVIALTAGVLAEEREAVQAAGMTGFLAKPLDLEQMVAVLRIYVPGQVFEG